ncbi:MAG: CRISPR-associated endonuclease Cas2 [Patescibacteria group bacterium]|nr:CRISPR-associated endonuclease Cas2 [Patescibacteria group bacterium]
MYYIAVYDVAEKRVAKMLKLMRQYLHWIQNSVFEGELSKGKMEELIAKANRLMKKNEDSLIIFEMDSSKFVDKKIFGLDKTDKTSNFI